MNPSSRAPRHAPGFAVPARLHVFLLFMTEFVLLLVVLGGVVPTLHRRGISPIVLIAGSTAFIVAMFWGLGVLGRLLRVRCRSCGSRARFRGSAWWPFIYRYDCPDCGRGMRLEVGG
jgi:hypothetical protein